MADTAAPRKRFDARNPGAREYLIVGGIALLVGLAYLYWKNHSAAASGTTAASANAPGAVDANGNPVPGVVVNQGGGMDAGGLASQMQDQQSSPTTAAGGGSGGSGGVGGGGGAGGVGGGAGAGAALSGQVPLPQQSSVMALSASSPLASAPAKAAPSIQQQAAVSVNNLQRLGAAPVPGSAPLSRVVTPAMKQNLTSSATYQSQVPKAPAPAPPSPRPAVSVNNLKRLGV